MTSVPLSYRIAVAAARVAAPAFGASGSKLGRGLAGRRDAHGVLRAWGEARRDPTRPLAWFHAPSVGEGLQARAVMQALRAILPDLQVVYTYFSPSAEDLGDRFGADVSGFLPWDQRSIVGSVIDVLRPDVLVFTKTEVWPVLVAEAVQRGIPVALAAATVAPDAGRLRWPARAVLRDTWRSLSAGYACSEHDAQRLRSLGVPSDNISVSGDPGIDSAAERASAVDLAASHLAPFQAHPAPTVVAGSTWPSDEAVLIPALSLAREQLPELRVILAPHEPSEDRVGSLIGTFIEQGWHPSSLEHVEGEGELGGADAVVVERVGVLADLYRAGSVAYVGGGFHDAGLHSVLEPAAAGVPVLFGPRHQNAQAAGELVAAGAAAVVHDVDDVAHAALRWLTSRETNVYAGERARAYIESHRGAARRTAQALASLITRPDSR